jgi:hypothetical protein
MTTLPGSQGTGQAGRPTRWASWAVRSAALVLPSEYRWRYRREFLAELYEMTPSAQRRHATGVLWQVWTLRMALTEPARLLRKEAAMAKPVLCRIGRHRWQRLHNPEGGWYRECRGCGTQRADVDEPAEGTSGLLPPWVFRGPRRSNRSSRR